MTSVLLIEDDAGIGHVLRLLLEDEGYQVAWCQWGSEGLEAALAERPRAVVLDLMLPDTDGGSVLRALKRDPRTYSTPVIVMSAVADRLGPDEASLAQAVLSKPIDVGKLLEAIQGVGAAA